MFYRTYEQAWSAAYAMAAKTGIDVGIELSNVLHPHGYRTFFLPKKENRSGHEIQCEVVLAPPRDEASSSR